MFPGQSIYDSANSLLPNAILGCKFVLGNSASSVAHSDRNHFGVGKRGSWFSLAFALASLFNHVSHVVGLTSQEQVLVVDAYRVVAPMQKVDAIGDWSNREFVGDTMRQSILAAAIIDDSVAMFVDASSPRNASIFKRRSNVFREAFAKRGGITIVERSDSAFIGAESAAAIPNFVGSGQEYKRCSAVFAILIDGDRTYPSHLHLLPGGFGQGDGCNSIRSPASVVAVHSNHPKQIDTKEAKGGA